MGKPKTHGHYINRTQSPTYSSWAAMKKRTTLPKNKSFKTYGAVGVTVCERWQKFENFLEDMGEKPEGMSLDRIDNSQGYSKENCRWATSHEQSRNTKRNVLVEHEGKLMCLKDYADATGQPYSSVKSRWIRGNLGLRTFRNPSA